MTIDRNWRVCAIHLTEFDARFACPACEAAKSSVYTDLNMWLAIRSGLLAIIDAIERFAERGPLTIGVLRGLTTIVDAIERRFNLKKRSKDRYPKV